MATTTNYAWETPDDTDLVKDGAAAIRTLGSSIDTTTKALNPSTTLGDIEYRSSTANTNTRLGIGSTGQVLTVSGGVPAWATPSSGKVVQIVYGSTATGAGSATTTFADTNLSATITPTSSSNKILVMFNQNGCHKYNANTRLQIRLVRGSTTILNSESFAGNNDGSGGNAFGSSSAVYLDSPATTSATTYKTQFANQAGAGTVYVNDQTSPGSTSTMVLMEVTP